MPIILKTCTQCKQTKSSDSFPPDKRNPDGKQAKCRACRAANQRDYARRNPDKKRESDKRYRQDHPDAIREKKRQYSQDNRERLNQLSADWRRNNKERSDAIGRAYRKRNPETHRENHRVTSARYRARKENADGDCTPAQWQAILNRYAPDGRCPACGEKRPLTLDHVIPMKLGGTNNPDNLQPLCRHCNEKKAQKTTDYRR